MKRLHLFEIEDFTWYPKIIREGQTDYLRFLAEFFDVYRAVFPKFLEAYQQSGQSQLVDFCSGGGGAILLFRNYFKEHTSDTFRAILTDLYPNIPAFEHLKKMTQHEINFYGQSVNALQPPTDLKGFRTFFNSFHHFRPQEAREILRTAIQNRQPIGIFEPMEKSVFQYVINILALSLVLVVAMPFVRPFKWNRLIFTYLIPVIPLGTFWDGMVSILRLYTPKDFEKIMQEIDKEKVMKWQTGTARHRFGRVTYFIAIPNTSSM